MSKQRAGVRLYYILDDCYRPELGRRPVRLFPYKIDIKRHRIEFDGDFPDIEPAPFPMPDSIE